MYKLNKDRRTGEFCSVNRTNADGTETSIPFSPDNTDYQEYLKWLSEGNEPLPADEGTV